MYEEQMNIFWNTKRNHLIKCINEKKILKGTISLESQEIEKRIKDHERYLRKRSSSFKKDLEKRINADKAFTLLYTNRN